MIEATKEFKFEAAHRLPDHPGACRNIHGHSYVVQVTVAADHEKLNDQGMVLDFSLVKKAVEEAIGHWDHSLILFDEDHLYKRLRAMQNDGFDGLHVHGVPFIPTAENMAQYIASTVNAQLPDGIRAKQVRVYETTTSFADWKVR